MDRDPWAWTETAEGRALIDAATALEEVTPAAIARLRRSHDADAVRRALELVEARRRAEGRLEDAGALLLDRTATEQASSTDVARWKARRFAAAGVDRVLDLCAGIGGDAIGFTLEGIEPVLVERDPIRLAAARHNVARFLGCPPPAILTDVTDLEPTQHAFHLDPDRRPGGRRSWRYEDVLPGPETIEAWIAAGGPGAVKLGPGVELASLPPGEVEIIQRGRGLVQAVLWTGPLAGYTRRASRVDDGATFAAEPVDLSIGSADPPVGSFLHEVEPAIERASLLGALAALLGLTAPHEHAGFLVGAAPVRDTWLNPTRLVALLPGRTATVREWLAAQGAGRVVLRTRGVAENAEWERALTGGATEGVPHTVRVTREGARLRAWVTVPVEEE